MALTPSFYANLLASSEPGQLQSLRVCITGAEKAPKALIEHLYKMNPQAKLLEGYGITECSPVLSAQRFREENHIGVGRALSKVELIIVDRESLKPLPQGEDWEILARGPSIFKGYIEKDIKFLDRACNLSKKEVLFVHPASIYINKYLFYHV